MSLLDRVKQHWIGSLIALCAVVVGATWKVAWEVHVAPRDFQIAQLKDEIARAKADSPSRLATAASAGAPALPSSRPDGVIVLPETGVFEGRSATTSDGRIAVKVTQVLGDSTSLLVTLDAEPPIEFKNRAVGSRISINAGNQLYFLDIQRVRGNIVDLLISRHSK